MRRATGSPCFSALQRAENSSIGADRSSARRGRGFQCSSASRKFLNRVAQRAQSGVCWFQCSSASRKFLNIVAAARHKPRADVSVLFSEPKIPQYSPRSAPAGASRAFQCSSASRKFLNIYAAVERALPRVGFSALQRAENSSISADTTVTTTFCYVSVLFSEPKIPQCLSLERR